MHIKNSLTKSAVGVATPGRLCGLALLVLALWTPTVSAQISSDTFARRLLKEGRIDERQLTASTAP
jgi:hypothetical protein